MSTRDQRVLYQDLSSRVTTTTMYSTRRETNRILVIRHLLSIREKTLRVHDSQRQRDYIITVLKRVISGCRAIIDYRLRATGTHRASTR